MGKGILFGNEFLDLLDKNEAIGGVGDAGGLQPSAVAGNLYVSLHTSDPGLMGTQLTNEAAYTGYGRVGVPRSAVGWTIFQNRAWNAQDIVFGVCTGGAATITHVGIGTAAAGAGLLLYSFPLFVAYYPFHAETTNNQFHQDSGFSANDPIQFINLLQNALPTPLATDTTYYVKTILSADLFSISTTPGGAELTITSNGFGLVGKITPFSVSPGITPQFLSGQLQVYEL